MTNLVRLVLCLFLASMAEGAAVDKQIGQMLLVGFRGLTVDTSSPIAKDLKAGRIGGVLFFDYDIETKKDRRNIQSPDQVKTLVRSIRALTKDKLFISIDQEGGKVNRLKEKYGFPPSLTARQLAALPEAQMRKEVKVLAENLASLGFNLNFAPSADLDVNATNPIIGKFERSFSEDPETVVDKAAIFIEAHRAAKVLTVLKHFPGHGSSTADSHLGLVDVSSTWTEKELDPFYGLIKAGLADAVMTAHVFNSHLDSKHPATLSPSVIPQKLRKDGGFDGVVFSDDMQMGAILKHYGLETAIELALGADVDVLCFGNNLVYDEQIAEKAHGIISKLVSSGKIPASRIQRSADRIAKLKSRL